MQMNTPKGAMNTASAAKVGRNDPCPCGSGKKFKHCHSGAGAELAHPARRK
jgi:uncharacterized protein YecA (UPF0149 family)